MKLIIHQVNACKAGLLRIAKAYSVRSSVGSIDVINHYVLRSILWISGRTPLRLIRCLDGPVEIRLLRRIGGGYAFIHRTLLEYFAAREPISKS